MALNRRNFLRTTLAGAAVAATLAVQTIKAAAVAAIHRFIGIPPYRPISIFTLPVNIFIIYPSKVKSKKRLIGNPSLFENYRTLQICKRFFGSVAKKTLTCYNGKKRMISAGQDDCTADLYPFFA